MTGGWKCWTRRPWALAILWGAAAVMWAGVAAAELPGVGDTLPTFTLPTPGSAEDRAALGLADSPTFALGDMDAQCVLFEVIGVYCVECHKQAPIFSRLHARLAKDEQLAGRVKMLAMAAGATEKEVEYLRAKGNYPFVVVNDPDYVAHKILGEPKTPFTMIVTREGKVVFAHLGVIADTAALFREFEKLCR
ncbi:TlpA family protein disulfide reductase [Desulfovibrio sulfodismutans]|uniref:TlpA family protein disulfide reductase n=1 Tax=Desulfolutivibrio sulfodismutans TaxID=63561 RepID=A0A7K3NGM1_9BACT|nr:TlpA disulfide reductase family protein [Desulfolutivibrio sulfodismutans]NDY55340.1 TlpA family protein disulfide reductase [Desulfolutivibrio sulfodismutans]QLA11041.1 TlpA family protein disulfide reductase [Desulfolutivibrio sulfodismutans DSM 3696]